MTYGNNDSLNLIGKGQGCNRHSFLRGQSHFSWFFPGVKCFFPVENFPFWQPTQNKFLLFSKVKKKKVLTSFRAFPTSISNFEPSLYNFPSFLLNFYPFPLFSFPIFPDTSAKISRSEISGEALCPPANPPPVTPLVRGLVFLRKGVPNIGLRWGS